MPRPNKDVQRLLLLLPEPLELLVKEERREEDEEKDEGEEEDDGDEKMDEAEEAEEVEGKEVREVGRTRRRSSPLTAAMPGKTRAPTTVLATS